ncbi:hypothetical protein L6452_36363 [Arctium lappa]|uniref:Uncharacterized protein n=1 Tax=Arctium lappa TaxID=4217 RepID=A0ACB8YD76_ARCLA|nr:hypothetical protein L6452_36363 [Arctium lappa]
MHFSVIAFLEWKMETTFEGFDYDLDLQEGKGTGEEVVVSDGIVEEDGGHGGQSPVRMGKKRGARDGKRTQIKQKGRR